MGPRVILLQYWIPARAAKAYALQRRIAPSLAVECCESVAHAQGVDALDYEEASRFASQWWWKCGGLVLGLYLLSEVVGLPRMLGVESPIGLIFTYAPVAALGAVLGIVLSVQRRLRAAAKLIEHETLLVPKRLVPKPRDFWLGVLGGLLMVAIAIVGTNSPN
jgi:hypothetical protein